MKNTFFRILCVTQLMVAGGLYGISCVQDGMNLWRLAENISCSTGAYCELRQSDFNPVGLTLISTPGRYKLCENVDGSGQTVLITVDNVILDLGEYTMTNFAGIGIDLSINNVIIRNGTIRDGIADGVVLIGPSHQNIIIEDLIIDTIIPGQAGEGSAIRAGGLVTGGNVDGFLVRNVTIYNGGTTNIFINGVLAPNNNVILENIQCVNTNPAFVTVPANPSGVVYLNGCDGPVLRNIALYDQWVELNGITFNNCADIVVDGVIVISGLEAGLADTVAYQVLNSSTGGIHRNIVIDGGLGVVFDTGLLLGNLTRAQIVENASVTAVGKTNALGFSLLGSEHILRSCNVTLATNDSNGQAFNIQAQDTLLESCVATKSDIGYFLLVSAPGGVSLVDCVATANDQGFQLSSAPGFSSLHGCSASFNATVGFSINANTAPTSFSYCEAVGNGTDGYQISSVPSTFSYCSAVTNGDIGFNIDSNGTPRVVLQECLASDNSSSGIDAGAGTNVFLIDTRSSSIVVPTYQLNGAADVFGAATIITF